MIQECPHCHTKILPVGKRCTACGKNVHDTAGADLTVTSLRISHSAALPCVCCQCNLPTERRVRVKRTRRWGDHPLLIAFFWITYPVYQLSMWLASQFMPIAYIQSSAPKSRRRTVCLYMPYCDSCAARATLDPRYVDFEKHSMTFLVHREFAEQVQNSKA